MLLRSTSPCFKMDISSHILLWISYWIVSINRLDAIESGKRSKALTDIVRLARETYDDLKVLPPNFDSDEAAKIKVKLYVSSVDAVNEASMDFTVGILLHLRWFDRRIYNTKAEGMFAQNFDMIDFDSESIQHVWVPDIFFPNEKKGYYHDIMSKNEMMRLYKGGELLYISRLTVTLSCPMNLLNYPFDKQTCHLLIMSFGYSDQDVVFEWMNSTEPNMSEDCNGECESIKLSSNILLPQFEVKSVVPDTCNIKYHQKEGNHSCLRADFKMERNIGFYIVQMYIPSMLIVMLSWISFWLTVNSVPGRISLGLLTVLTMTTQSSSVNAALPRVSYTKAIDVWMSTCLVFVFAALLEFAVVNVLSRNETIKGFSLKHVFSVPGDLKSMNDVAEVSLPLDGFTDAPKKRRFKEKGIVYAMYLDICARIFFPLAFTVFIIAYWLYYVNA